MSSFSECIQRLRASLERGERSQWDDARAEAELRKEDPEVNALGRDFLRRLDEQAEAIGWR